MKPRILIVDDEAKIRNILSKVLKDEGYEVSTASSGEEAIESSATAPPNLVLMDLSLPGMDGISAMVEIRKEVPELDVIIITAYGTIESAVDAIKKGAYDYLPKPFDNEELLLLVGRALEHRRLALEVRNLREQLRERYSFENIIGHSPGMRQVFELMNSVCELDATVLIQGESGTGKELVVRAIHQHSARKDKPLVAINCGAVPETLFESEFFGYERGAFTDAKQRKLGKFEQANGGTLFLDEIGELSLSSQVKLLRALENQEITRIGGAQPIPIDVRIIAATNRNLEESVRQSAFRQDLYYRLNVFCIFIPPLRERGDDLSALVDFILQKYNKKLGLEIGNISKNAMDLLRIYSWPGNVRELENTIQGAMIICRSGLIEPQDLPLRIQGYAEGEESARSEGTLEYRVKAIAEQVEKKLILETLAACSYNRTETAKSLGVSRKTLYNKMLQFGITE